MELKTYFDQNDHFYKYITMAIGAHFILLLLAVLTQFILGFDLFKNNSKSKQVKIIQSSVRVDIVAMPKFTVQELKKMKISPAKTEDKSQEAKPIADNSKSDIVYKKKGKKVNLSSLLNNLSQKKIAKKNKKKTKSSVKYNSTKLRKLILEGNKISKGTATVGDTLEQEQTEFNTYVSSLPGYVRPFWKLPSYLLEAQLKCRIRVFIAANGTVLRSDIFQSSGVQEFDQKAISALKQVKKFPVPKKEILARVTSGEVILGFPL